MKRCKCACDCTRDLDVLKADRFSQLPEVLILKILSLLPTKEAIATSVLSKQWRSLWMMLPKLKFDSRDHKTVRGTKTYSTNVCRSLLSHQGPVLRSLHLITCFSRCTTIDTGILIGLALSRNVRELVLENSHTSVFKFPRCLLYNCETLETLKLKYSARINVPSHVCLKSLTTLHLDYVSFKNDESVLNLLSGCPNLKNLMVQPYSSKGGLKALKAFKIVMPSLQRLSIFVALHRHQHRGYVINAPSLKYLKIEGIYGLQFCLIEHAPKLVEASIIDVSDIIEENLLESLTSVTRLSLGLSSPLKIKFPTGSLFRQLVYLELYTNKVAWWNLLTLMLVSSPKLQVLKLIYRLESRTDSVAHGKWNQPNNVAECLLLHLETFLWYGYKEQLEEEIEVAKYILRNANCLKKATFSIKGLNSDERLEMLKELESVVKVSSSSCQLVLLK